MRLFNRGGSHMRLRQRNIQNGLTLLELIVGLAIVSFSLILGFPSFSASLNRAKVQTVSSAFSTSLAQARLLAVLKRTKAVVCPSQNGHYCDSSTQWEQGWIVFLDSNQNDQREKSEAIVSVQTAYAGVKVRSTQGRRRVSFQADGRSAGSNLTMTVCAATQSMYARQIVLSNSGRSRSVTLNACPS